MDATEDELIDALERARRPWNQAAIEELASRAVEVKTESALCRGCEQPCEEAEICATFGVNELELLEEVGRDQAFHHIESGMKRSALAENATFRMDGEKRPNTFFRMSE